MPRKALLLPLLAVVILVVAVAILFRPGARDSTRVASGVGVAVPFESGMVVSPDRERAVLVASDGSTPQVWLTTLANGARVLLTTLAPGEEARKAAWSSDGRMVAFEVSDSSGHSPMTTTHVWVADTRGGKVEELRLPPPNERFSTYLGAWQAPDTLRISATLLEFPDDVHYLYRSSTGRLEGPRAERKEQRVER